MLVCPLIMSLAGRLSSKFHICPRSFASRPNVHLSDNLSAADRHYRPTYQPPEGVYLLNILGDFSAANDLLRSWIPVITVISHPTEHCFFSHFSVTLPRPSWLAFGSLQMLHVDLFGDGETWGVLCKGWFFKWEIWEDEVEFLGSPIIRFSKECVHVTSSNSQIQN